MSELTRGLAMLETLFATIAATSVGIYAFIDPAWAIPANTLLLVILAIVNHRVLKTGRQAAQHAEEVKVTAKEAHNELKSMANNQHKRGTD